MIRTVKKIIGRVGIIGQLVAIHMVVVAVFVLLSVKFVAVPTAVNDDAGWCWFQDERALSVGNKVIVGSVSAGIHDVTRSGDIEVSSLDLSTGDRVRFTLSENFELDDHDAPALMKLPDGRILAVYTKHNKDTLIRYRISLRAGDISAWTPERTYVPGAGDQGVTYANLFSLPAKDGLIYDLYRGQDFDPSAIVSDDSGETWSYAGRVLEGPGRPYVRYTSDGIDTVHFVATEQHPDDFNNSLYYGFLRNGSIYNSEGMTVGALGTAPPNPADLTKIFQGDENNVAWPSDFQYYEGGVLAAVYSVQKNKVALSPGQLSEDHRYRYARFEDGRWTDYEIGFAGTSIYPSEENYTGLITLHPRSPNMVYFSANADPRTGWPLISSTDHVRHFEIYRGTTDDGGKTWRFTAITRNSSQDNIRPYVPQGDQLKLPLLWLREK